MVSSERHTLPLLGLTARAPANAVWILFSSLTSWWGDLGTAVAVPAAGAERAAEPQETAPWQLDIRAAALASGDPGRIKAQRSRALHVPAGDFREYLQPGRTFSTDFHMPLRPGL